MIGTNQNSQRLKNDTNGTDMDEQSHQSMEDKHYYYRYLKRLLKNPNSGQNTGWE
jgi:hypothetical protein